MTEMTSPTGLLHRESELTIKEELNMKMLHQKQSAQLVRHHRMLLPLFGGYPAMLNLERLQGRT